MERDTFHAITALNEQQSDQPAPPDSSVVTRADQAAIDAFIREHPHLKEATPAWQAFYYRVRTAVMTKP